MGLNAIVMACFWNSKALEYFAILERFNKTNEMVLSDRWGRMLIFAIFVFVNLKNILYDTI